MVGEGTRPPAGGPEAGVVDRVFRAEHGRAVATVTRVLGDVGEAEDAVSEAYVTALRVWPERGLPDNPAAWITTTARNHGLDRLRRERRRVDKERAALRETERSRDVRRETLHPVADDELRLLFTCCHPALAPETSVALTLRLAAGLRTAEIARAFLQPEATVAQRLSRAKRRIRAAGIPFRVPDPAQLPQRLPAVLSCVELIYREGYAATGRDELVRAELCAEGVRLARLLAKLLPEEAEVLGLAALVCLLDARRASRTTPDGDLLTLEHQDRRRWDRDMIAEATATLGRAAELGRPGPYQVRAAIAAEHATAPSWAATDWPTIAALYAALVRLAPSPVAELNRSVAIAFAETAADGLAHLETVADDPRLSRSHLLHATRADLLRRLGRHREAAQAYSRALELAPTGAERRHLQRRLRELETVDGDGSRASGGASARARPAPACADSGDGSSRPESSKPAPSECGTGQDPRRLR